MNKKVLFISFVCLGIIASAIYGIFDFKAKIHKIEMTRELVQGRFPKDKEIKLGFYLDSRGSWYRKNRVGVSEDARIESEYIHGSPIPPEIESYTRLGLDERYDFEESSSRKIREGESENDAALCRIEDYCMEDEVLSSLYMGMRKDGVTERKFKLREVLHFLPVKLSAFPNIYDGEKFEQRLAGNEEIIFKESRLEDYFRFPVPEDMQLSLNYDASREGEYLLTKMGAKLNESYASDLVDGFAERDLHGNRLFLSFKDSPHYKIPKQYEGIYLLPLHREETKENDFEDAFYRLREIKKIYEFGDDESLQEMLFTKNGSLCLLIRVGKSCELRLIDENGTEKSSRALCRIENADKNEALPRMIRGENGIFLLYDSKKFQWVDSSSLQVTLEGSLKIPNFEEFFNPLYAERCKLLFKDGILYLATSRDEKIRLIHLDETGILGIVDYRFPLESEQNATLKAFEVFHGFSVEGLRLFVD